jgi:hypothetical protein
MLTYFNNKDKTLYVMFRLNEFGNDTLRIGIAPRDSNGEVIKSEGVSFYIFRNMNYKVNLDGKINYRDLSNFIDGITHIVNTYNNGNPNGEKLQFSDSYVNAKTDHVITFTFGVTEREGIPYRILVIKDRFKVRENGKEVNKELQQIYTFRDDEELSKFIKFLKMFKSNHINFMCHMIVSELKQSIKDSVGEQIRMIVRDELNRK